MGQIRYISQQAIYEQYLSEIYKYPNRDHKLGSAASKILVQFSMRPYMSTYQIYSLLKTKGEKEMAYKNVHRYVKELYSLKLIEHVDKKSVKTVDETIHHPIYYRLTTGGIFHLISEDHIYSILKNDLRDFFVKKDQRKFLLENYSDNIIFKTLLFPYFQKETLSNLNNKEIITEILNYLESCCHLTRWIGRLSPEVLVHSINNNLLNLAVSIIMRITESTDHYEILSQDVKLLSLLDKTMEVLEERYQTLVQLRKNN